MDIFKDAWAQLGAMGLLLAGCWYWIKTSVADRKEERARYDAWLEAERKRNDLNFERVYTLAQASERTAAELTNAVKGLHP